MASAKAAGAPANRAGTATAATGKRLVLGGGTKTEDREAKSAAARSTRGNTTRPARAIAINPEDFKATGQKRLSQNSEPVKGSRDHDGRIL